MNNLVDIKDFFSKKQTEKDKVDFIKAQYNTILELQKQNSELKEKAEHLETLLKGTSKIETIILSPEQALIDEQIHLLQMRTSGQELELEDVKKLDLLIKNKQLLKTSPKTYPGSMSHLSVSSTELLKLAKLPNE